MNTPRFMLCTPKESEEYLLADADYLIDTDSCVLWVFEGDNGEVAEWLSEPIKDPQILAKAAREAGEWLADFYRETES